MKNIFLTLILSVSIIGVAQDDKTVSITVSGQGKNESEARQAALRGAIEQAYGTFISSNTSILNDNLIKDEIVSVSSGNIQKYDVLNTSTLPDGSTAITLNAVVSVSKLIGFSEAKGVVIEFKGGLFTINVKQQILNEQAEVKAIWEMLFLLNPIAFQSFDYTIQSKDPQSLDAENKNWAVPITVVATANKNIDFLFDYFQKNVASIALKPEEVANYLSLNKKVFPITLNSTLYNFRKEESQIAITKFFFDFPAIMRNFIIDNGFSKDIGNNIFERNRISEWEILHPFKEGSQEWEILSPFKKGPAGWNIPNDFISYSSGTKVGNYPYKDLKTLSELEKLSGYKVSPVFPTSKVGSWYAGGIIFYENTKGGGLIAALEAVGEVKDHYDPDPQKFRDLVKAQNEDFDKLQTSSTSVQIGSGASNTKAIVDNCKEIGIAARLCDDAWINNFNDWFLPSRDELHLLYLQKQFLNNVNWTSGKKRYGLEGVYLSSSFYIQENPPNGSAPSKNFWTQYFIDRDSEIFRNNKNGWGNHRNGKVIAVRAF